MSKIKINQVSEFEVEVTIANDVPMEMVNQLVKGLTSRGMVEHLQKSTLCCRRFYKSEHKADAVADELIKSLENMTKGKPPYPFSSWEEHGAWREKNRRIDRENELKRKGVPVPPRPSLPSQSGPNTLPGTPNKLHSPEMSGKVNYGKVTVKSDGDVEKSNTGPKGTAAGAQYDVAANVRRKANNIGDVAGEGPNKNVKSFSTRAGQLSSKAGADDLARRQAKLNRKQPVKIFSQEEKAALAAQMGTAKKSDMNKAWADHLPFPSAEEQNAQRMEDAMATQLAQLMSGKAMLNNVHRNPTSEEMIAAGEQMGLGVSENMVKNEDNKWNGAINNWLAEATKPISQRFASEEEELAYWNSLKVNDGDDGRSGY